MNKTTNKTKKTAAWALALALALGVTVPTSAQAAVPWRILRALGIDVAANALYDGLVALWKAPPDAVYQKANAGDANAMYVLGRRYETGEGVPRDWNTAVSLYRQAAQRGNPHAMARLRNLGLGY